MSDALHSETVKYGLTGKPLIKEPLVPAKRLPWLTSIQSKYNYDKRFWAKFFLLGDAEFTNGFFYANKREL